MSYNLGSLEEMILLIVLVMEGEAYGVSVAEAYMDQTGKSISIPAIHTVLRRLEKKGFIASQVGGSTTLRGGRSKRIYHVTKGGYAMLKSIQDNRNQLWKMVPKFNG